MLIARVAYLVVCSECGMHGHIVLANGSISIEFRIKAEGYAVVDELLAEKKITGEEAKQLKEAIAQSTIRNTKHPLTELIEIAEDIREDVESLLEEHEKSREQTAGSRSHTLH